MHYLGPIFGLGCCQASLLGVDGIDGGVKGFVPESPTQKKLRDNRARVEASLPSVEELLLLKQRLPSRPGSTCRPVPAEISASKAVENGWPLDQEKPKKKCKGDGVEVQRIPGVEGSVRLVLVGFVRRPGIAALRVPCLVLDANFKAVGDGKKQKCGGVDCGSFGPFYDGRYWTKAEWPCMTTHDHAF
ncbi:hypothetical protein B0H16DRAFT_1485030 [Mycena metata]|uniref:Uncharacterized protein n=1 Tax=Mycena metata TaxID=1033252 RepID=A0AAD7DPJ6_9AGAR|nr:hypothetical protein B0H16DRAFT_1485030 [Mycena metata]